MNYAVEAGKYSTWGRVVELGSLAELLSAVGAMGALIAASIAAWAALKANSQQQDELKTLQQEQADRVKRQERAAASTVAVWPRTDRHGAIGVRYINTSGLPIYAVAITIELPGRSVPVHYPVIGPSPTSRQLRQATEKLQAACGDVDWPDLLERGSVSCSLEFRDLEGRTWRRGPQGHLEKEASASSGGPVAAGSTVTSPASRP